jgi:hypothetical protein
MPAVITSFKMPPYLLTAGAEEDGVGTVVFAAVDETGVDETGAGADAAGEEALGAAEGAGEVAGLPQAITSKLTSSMIPTMR